MNGYLGLLANTPVLALYGLAATAALYFTVRPGAGALWTVQHGYWIFALVAIAAGTVVLVGVGYEGQGGRPSRIASAIVGIGVMASTVGLLARAIAELFSWSYHRLHPSHPAHPAHVTES